MAQEKALIIGITPLNKQSIQDRFECCFLRDFPLTSKGKALSQTIQTFKPNIIITNLYFQNRTIQEAITTLNKVRQITSTTQIRVIIATECDNTAVYQYALLSGINGYIHLKGSRQINIAKAIEQMAYGPRIKPSRHWLTLKEWMVCHSLITAPGASSSERAKALDMSESNYYRLLNHSQKKIGAESTLEVAVKFMSPAKALGG